MNAINCISGCSGPAQMDINGHLLTSHTIWQFIALLVVHWFADFGCQTHWQASNKSKSNIALFRHVLVYFWCLSIASVLIFSWPWLSWPQHFFGLRWLGFVWLNAVLHFVTDWCTSWVTSRLFMEQFQVLSISNSGVTDKPKLIANQNFTLHNFFVVIGLDQLIHQVTLATTMVLFFGN